jgi:LmbE family N-acetylglucosaminyl deacetylase
MIVVTLVVLTGAVDWIHPLFLLAQGLSTSIIIFKVVPFYHRSINCVYSGLAMARIPYSILTLVLQIVNKNNDDQLGGIIGGVAIASYVGCFFFGFTVMMIYITYVRWRVAKYDDILVSGENLNQVNLWYLDIVLRLSANTPKLRAEAEKTVKYAALNNMESLELNLTRAVLNIYMPGGSLMLASHLLQKVNTFRPNLLYKFTLYLRYRDLEINIGETNNKKRIYALLNNAHDVQKELQLYVTLFFKNIVSGNPDIGQLSMFAHRAYKAEKECTRVMESLLTQYPKDISVVRNYAKFIEDVKRDPEAARDYYEEASALEDQEQERAAQKRRVFVRTPDTPTDDESSKNAIIPLHADQSEDEEVERYKARKEMRRSSSRPMYDRNQSIGSGSVTGSQGAYKKQDVYRKKLLNKDNKWGLRLIISSFGAGLVLLGVIGTYFNCYANRYSNCGESN